MKSADRREGRFHRRKAARRANEIKKAAKRGTFEEVFSFENLYTEGKKCCNGTRWKASTQRFEANLLTNAANLRRELLSSRYKGRGFHEFGLYERGHYRWIKSVHITDRAVQKVFNTHVLRPAVTPTLIYANGACQPGKGTDLHLEILEAHLHRHYRHHGREGGILLWDFKSFFDTIPHKALTEAARRRIVEPRLAALFEKIVGDFGEVGLGLGSEISQTSAVFVVNRIDHYFKDRLRVKGYAHYADDGYIISADMDFLRECLRKFRALAEELGLTLNENKTKIVRLTHQFTFLKKRFRLTETGAVIRRLSRDNLKKRRRLLRKFREKMDAGKMTIAAVLQSYTSWRGYASRARSYKTLRRMDTLFKTLFRKELEGVCLPF